MIDNKQNKRDIKDRNCSKCGLCCLNIKMNITPEQFEINKIKHKNIDNDYTSFLRLLEYKNKNEKGEFIYYCSNLDKETLLCKVYENRPIVCRNYPFNYISSDKIILQEEKEESIKTKDYLSDIKGCTYNIDDEEPK